MAAKSEAPRDPVRRWTLIILAAIVALYLYSIIADRMTPYTSQAIAINKPTQRMTVTPLARLDGRHQILDAARLL